MNNIKGPAIFLAQFVGEDAPFNSLDNICKWVSSLGDRKSTRLNSSHSQQSRMPSSA